MKDLIYKFNEAPKGLKFIYGIFAFMVLMAILYGIYELITWIL
jgi:hypothetical protein